MDHYNYYRHFALKITIYILQANGGDVLAGKTHGILPYDIVNRNRVPAVFTSRVNARPSL